MCVYVCMYIYIYIYIYIHTHAYIMYVYILQPTWAFPGLGGRRWRYIRASRHCGRDLLQAFPGLAGPCPGAPQHSSVVYGIRMCVM